MIVRHETILPVGGGTIFEIMDALQNINHEVPPTAQIMGVFTDTSTIQLESDDSGREVAVPNPDGTYGTAVLKIIWSDEI